MCERETKGMSDFMNENNVMNQEKKKFGITLKNVMRLLSVLCAVFVFCPVFLVSCSGNDMNISAMIAVKGISVYEQQVVDPHPVMLICLLLPIAVLVLLFLKKLSEQKTAGIIVACGIADFIIWIIFRSTVKNKAEENYCSFKTTGWYAVNLIVILLLILFSILIALKKIEMEKDLISLFSSGGGQEILNQMSDTVGRMSNVAGSLVESVADNMNQKKLKEDAIGYCSKCGSPITYDCKFCISCGTPVPESMIAEAETARAIAEETARQEAAKAAEEETVRQKASGNGEKFCRNCGAKLISDAIFCESCGTKIN